MLDWMLWLLLMLRLCGFEAQALSCMFSCSQNLADGTVLLWLLSRHTRLPVLLYTSRQAVFCC